MQISQTPTEQGILFTVDGSLSRSDESAQKLFAAVSLALNQRPGEIDLDLARTNNMDSMSIGLLVGILLTCKELKIRFRVRNLTNPVRTALESTNLKKVFPELY